MAHNASVGGDSEGTFGSTTGTGRKFVGILPAIVTALVAGTFGYAALGTGIDEADASRQPNTPSASGWCGIEREDERMHQILGTKRDRPAVSRPDPCGVPLDSHERNDAFEAEILAMVAGYPIEAMVSEIARYDRDIAALLVGIAKKESDWGRRVPRDGVGDDCFNYWGFKAAGSRGVAMGHGCFGSPEEAVARVGSRIAELASTRTSEPAKMIVWKCGSSCEGHSPESVAKWISDVRSYYLRIVKL